MNNLASIVSKLVSLSDIIEIRNSLRKEGKKVVFSNGCFDIIHRGHVEYLSKAKDCGDILIIGLNSDSSIKNIKGPERPLQDEYTRSLVMASLQFVDYVVLFDEDTPIKLISKIIPDVLVKGADYKVEQIVGADVVLKSGGEVKTIELTQGHSTTNIINKMLHN